jgi:SAM-dependent methyltransferase
MRQKAIELARACEAGGKVRFLGNYAPGMTTGFTNLPFSQKADAILSNFAVMNAIPQPATAFKNLSQVVKPGGHFVLVVLKSSLKKRWHMVRFRALLSVFSSMPCIMTVDHNGRRQKVYLYTLKHITRFAAPYFRLQSRQSLPGHQFDLIHLVKK